MKSAASLVSWAAAVAGGRIRAAWPATGGNRCEGWSLDVDGAKEGVPPHLFLRFRESRLEDGDPYTNRREAEVYAALRDYFVAIPRLIAIHPNGHAFLTARLEGSATFRHIRDDRQRITLARAAVAAVAQLHSLDAASLELPSFGRYSSVTEAIAADIDTWWSMYRLSKREDALIEFARRWLAQNLPQVDSPPVLLHGDAGPGNFMFEGERFTGLVDWELSHLGDPMEDLAWFSMRSVMEPVPDFPRVLEEYEVRSGGPINKARLQYHRALVSFKVTIIRHRNLTGQPGASIVSRALNRRLLVDAIGEASGAKLPQSVKREFLEQSLSTRFDEVLDQLKGCIEPMRDNHFVVASIKDVVKSIKYLKRATAHGGQIEIERLEALQAVLGKQLASVGEGEQRLIRLIREGGLDEPTLLRFFAGEVSRDSFLAAEAMGGLAYRPFPSLLRDQPLC